MHPPTIIVVPRSLLYPAIILGLLCLGRPAASAQPTKLEAPEGFRVDPAIELATTQFLGGLCVLPNGDVYLYDGTSVVRRSGSASETIFTPPPVTTGGVFGSFLRPAPDGGSIYFGESSQSFIYRLPLQGNVDGQAPADKLEFSFDMTFDDKGRGFISSRKAGDQNRIYLLDSSTEEENDAVVVNIDGFSGPVLFHEGRLYYGTARFPPDVNQVVYFPIEALEEGIGDGNQIDFKDAIASGKATVLVDQSALYYNLAPIGGLLYASDANAGIIDRLTSEGTVQPFAKLALEEGQFGSVTFLAFRPGAKDFLAGAGSEGGTLYASLTDFSTFNEIVSVTPELFFRRGYVNTGPELDITDAVGILEFLFLGGTSPDPLIAADLNDDNELDVSDGVYLLAFLFTGGPEPPAPFQIEGPDPTP